MFRPETEDLLPRMAPKPSAPMLNEAVVRPQVPEVSILFGKKSDENNEKNSNTGIQQQQQSYAVWKKQMLPRVTFPTNFEQKEKKQLRSDVFGNNIVNAEHVYTRSNVYPLKEAPASPFLSSSTMNAGMNVLTYRHNLEGTTNTIYQQQHYTGKPLEIAPTLISSNVGNRDVLTICAGTQTDATGASPSRPQTGFPNVDWHNLAAKQDIQELLQIVQDIRQDQLCIMQICQALIINQQKEQERPQVRDEATQVDYDMYEHIREEVLEPPVAAPINKFLKIMKSPSSYHTPKGKPTAQSTAYRSNSPQADYKAAPYVQNQRTDFTNHSVLMDQLALKYLPREKLAELLQELNVDNRHAIEQQQLVTEAPDSNNIPLRNIENFERGPADISNASYKYLKKYRLLPEDHSLPENVPIANDVADHGPRYDVVQSPPINLRQSPLTHKIPPYQQCLPAEDGPLLAVASPITQISPTSEQILDLENIKHQPKFL
uniref:Uncharacterized protein n=1 Tax=Glossina brevipalpis TaxID=37001 RepID=A0A1A9WWQ8_9MUSC